MNRLSPAHRRSLSVLIAVAALILGLPACSGPGGFSFDGPPDCSRGTCQYRGAQAEVACRVTCRNGGFEGSLLEYLSSVVPDGPKFPELCDHLPENPAIAELAWDVDSAGCIVYLSTFQFQNMELVSVFPARRDGSGNYERLCGLPEGPNGGPDSLLFAVNLERTSGGSSNDAGPSDTDRSIRPGDFLRMGHATQGVVAEGDTISEGQFRIDIDCFEPYPDTDLASNAGCQGVTGPRGATPTKLAYRSFHTDELRPSATDTDALAVAILVDQSGSMKGFVEEGTGAEAIDVNSGPWDPVNWKENGSDPDGHRITAVRSFLGLLSTNDRAGVFRFGESVGGESAIVCDQVPEGSEADRRRECFGTNRKLVTESNALGAMQSMAKGRTPLWAAVSDVYDFMKNNVTSKVRHLVVITDGPDTCHPDSPDFQPILRKERNGRYTEFNQDSACASVGFEDFLAVVEGDMKDADGKQSPTNRAPVHVSFLQLQAKGYRYRDPRQQEIACRTGGHHLFINAQDLGVGEPGEAPLSEALLLAAARLRYALAGSWTLALDVPELATGSLPPGSELAVEGVIHMVSGLLMPDAQVGLRVGYEDSASAGRSIRNLDMRGSIRVPCVAGDSCEWMSGLGDCQAVECRAVDQVCMPSREAAGTSCGAGESLGSCCWGECVPGASPTSLDAFCNPAS